MYGKEFEDLDEVIDGSSPKKEIKPGYPVVNAMLVSKNKKQPIPVLSFRIFVFYIVIFRKIALHNY